MGKKQWQKLLVLTLLILCIVGADRVFAKEGQTLSGKAADILFRPMQSFFADLRDSAKQLLAETVFKDNLTRENRELREKLAFLEGENRQNAALKEENRRLRSLLSLSEETDTEKTVACRVISQDVTGARGTFLIDKGTKHGIQKEDAVICEKGLVGRVTAVYQNSAEVTPCTEEKSAVAARVVRTQEDGVAEYREGRFLFESFSEKTEGMEGDYIETSGMGGIYPAGLLLGTVEREEGQEIILAPSVDYRTLREVLVLSVRRERSGYER